MAVRAKLKRRPTGGGRGAFPRRLSWRDIELAFDHLFDVGLESPESSRYVERFRRARSQLLPIFSIMVVSPYERERALAVQLLERIGGRATLQMVESLLVDLDVYDAFKLELRHLRDSLLKRVSNKPDEDEDEDAEGVAESAADERRRARRRRGTADELETESEATPETGEEAAPQREERRDGRRGSRRRRGGPEREEQPAAPAADAAAGSDAAVGADAPAEAPEGVEGDETPRQPRPKARRGRGAGPAGRRGPQPARPKPFTDDEIKALFGRPGEAFLSALDGPVERLHEAFEKLDPPRRVSFVDRLASLDDARLMAFLLPLLARDEKALVQSALKALAARPDPAMLGAIEALLATSPPRTIRQRAEQLRLALVDLPQSEAGAEEAIEPRTEGDVEVESEDEPARRGRRRRRGGRGRGEAAPVAEADEVVEAEPAEEPELEPLPAGGDLGLRLPAAVPLTGESQPLESSAKLPRLENCLAAPLAIDGSQLLYVYRTGESGLERLTFQTSDAGWLAAIHETDLAPGADRVALQEATASGQPLVEVTVGYARRRVQHAAAINAELGLALPPYASAALAWLGSGRRADVEEEVPERAQRPSQERIEALLNHPLMAGWRIEIDPNGLAAERWNATRRRRSASRQRKLLIDDVVSAWLAEWDRETLLRRVQLQAWLLRRAEAEEAAETLLTMAVQLTHGHPLENPMLREIVYRAYGAAMVRDGGQRRRRAGRKRAGESESHRAAVAKCVRSRRLVARKIGRRRPRR